MRSLKFVFVIMFCVSAIAACNGLGTNECITQKGEIGTYSDAARTICVVGTTPPPACTVNCGTTPPPCTVNCTVQQQITLTVSVSSGLVHIWDGSDHIVGPGQSVTVNACSWRPPVNNQGASGPGIAFWVQQSSGSANYWGCDATPGSVNQITVTGNSRNVVPTPYVDPTACHGSGQLVNGFGAASAFGITCG